MTIEKRILFQIRQIIIDSIKKYYMIKKVKSSDLKALALLPNALAFVDKIDKTSKRLQMVEFLWRCL